MVAGNYSYVVVSIDIGGQQSENSTTGLNIKLTNIDTVANATNLSWTPVPYAISYRIFNATNVMNEDRTLNLSGYSSYFEVTGTNFVHYGQDPDGFGNFSDTSAAEYMVNCDGSTNYGIPVNCNITFSGLSSRRNRTVKIWLNDSAGNSINTQRTYSTDLEWPELKTAFNWAVSRGIASWIFEFNDTTPTTCEGSVYDRNGNIKGNLAGTFGTIEIDSNVNCTGTFTVSDVIEEGAFKIEFNVTDGLGRWNISLNKTGVLTNLYTGWNVITYPDSNRSVLDICNEVGACNQVSFFNNTNKSFYTFSNSTPSINNGTNINEGDGFLINVVENSEIITNDNLPLPGNELEGITLWTTGWNVMGLLANTSLNATYYALTVNTTSPPDNPNGGLNITYSSYKNTSSGFYLTCKRTLNKCSGTSAVPKDILLRKGYAVWALTMANSTINRTDISGA